MVFMIDQVKRTISAELLNHSSVLCYHFLTCMGTKSYYYKALLREQDDIEFIERDVHSVLTSMQRLFATVLIIHTYIHIPTSLQFNVIQLNIIRDL